MIGNGLVPALPFFLLVVLLLVGRSLAGSPASDSAADVVRPLGRATSRCRMMSPGHAVDRAG